MADAEGSANRKCKILHMSSVAAISSL